MKNSEDFKSEVYRLAEEKQKQIKLQKRRMVAIIPCIAIVVLVAVLSFGLSDLPGLETEDSAATEAGNQNNINKMEAQNDFEVYTVEADTTVDVAGNQAAAPNNESDGATVEGDSADTYEATVSGTPTVLSGNYLCIRMFFVQAKTQEPYAFAQVIDSPSELKKYFEENNCDAEESFYSFYTNEAFDGQFFIALNAKGYDFKGITQTDDAIEIKMELSQNEDSGEKACLVMLPLFEKQYDKTKRIDIIK